MSFVKYGLNNSLKTEGWGTHNQSGDAQRHFNEYLNDIWISLKNDAENGRKLKIRDAFYSVNDWSGTDQSTSSCKIE